MFFHPLDYLIIVAFILSLWAQFRVKGTFNKWSQVHASAGLTGAEAARRMLDANGLYDIPVEPVQGKFHRSLRSKPSCRAFIRAGVLRNVHFSHIGRLSRGRSRHSAQTELSHAFIPALYVSRG